MDLKNQISCVDILQQSNLRMRRMGMETTGRGMSRLDRAEIMIKNSPMHPKVATPVRIALVSY